MKLAKYRDPALHGLAALVLIASLFYLPRLRIDSDVLDWLPDDHEAVQAYVEDGERNGFAFDMVLVLPLNAGSPQTVVDFTETYLTEQTAYTDDVSYVLAPNDEHHDAVFRFVIRTPAGPDAREHVQRAQTEALAGLDKLETQLEKLHGAALRSSPKLAGSPVTNRALNEVVLVRGAPVIGLSYVVLFGLLILFLYDRPAMLFVSFAAMILASLSTFAFMGAWDIPLNLMTVAVPSLVLILSIADVLHISRHLRAHPGELSGVLAPCFWTTVTTGAGFASLMFTRLPILSGFAAASAVGICAAFFWSFYLFHATRSRHNQPDSARPERFAFGAYLLPLLPRARPAAVALIILAGLGLLLVPNLRADTNPIDYLPRDDRTYQDLTWIHEHHASPYRLDFQFEYDAKNNGREYRPGYAEAVQNVRATLKNHRYEDVFFTPLVQAEPPALRLSLGVPPETSSREIREQVRKITSFEYAGFPRTEATGFLRLFSLIVDNLLRTQVRSGLAALGLIFLILTALFRRPRYVLAGILFNTAPISLTLAYMALANIPLDISTVCVAGIAAGIVVDDTIHLLWALRRRQSSEQGNDTQESLSVTLTAVTQTTLIVCCGFAVLALSDVRTIHLFGGLLALTVGFAWLFDVLAISLFLDRPNSES